MVKRSQKRHNTDASKSYVTNEKTKEYNSKKKTFHSPCVSIKLGWERRESLSKHNSRFIHNSNRLSFLVNARARPVFLVNARARLAFAEREEIDRIQFVTLAQTALAKKTVLLIIQDSGARRHILWILNANNLLSKHRPTRRLKLQECNLILVSQAKN